MAVAAHGLVPLLFLPVTAQPPPLPSNIQPTTIKYVMTTVIRTQTAAIYILTPIPNRLKKRARYRYDSSDNILHRWISRSYAGVSFAGSDIA